MAAVGSRPIGELIQEMLEAYRMNDKMAEMGIRKVWETLMGTFISRHTRNITVVDQRIIAEMDSAALRHELTLVNEKILEKLKKMTGNSRIKEILFR